MTRIKKSDKKNKSDSLENSSNNFIQELEIRALRAKNKKLAQSFAALQSTNAELQLELNSMKSQFFDVSCKLANFDSIHTTIGTTVKECIPKLAKLSSLFSQLVHLISIGNAINNKMSSDSATTTTRESRTHAVKPQIVNGHVLCNPTINLLRITNNLGSNNIGNENVQIRDNQQNNMDGNDEATGGSSNQENIPDNGNKTVDQVYRRNDVSLHGVEGEANPEEDSNEISEEDNAEEEDVNVDENEENQCNYDLYTLQEEDEEMQLSTHMMNIREIRIPLEPLSHSILFNNMKKLSIELGRSFENSQNNTTTIANSKRNIDDNDDSSNITNSSTPQTKKICLKRGGRFSVNNKSKNNNNDSNDVSINIERVCLQRGNRVYYQNETTDSFDSILQCRASDIARRSSMINNASTSGDETTLLDETVGFCDDLPLNNREYRLTTSTPIAPENIGRERSLFRRTINATTASITNVTTDVTNRAEEEEEETQEPSLKAIQPRTSLERRLSGSPIKKVGDILEIRVTRSSLVTRESIAAKRPSNSSAVSTAVSETMTTTTRSSTRNSTMKNIEEESQESSVATENVNRPKQRKQSKKTGTETVSTRPKRAAKPTTLTEPSSKKKLRRSK